MTRREYLTALGTVGMAGAIAGCVGGDQAGTASPTESPTPTETSTPTETPTPTPSQLQQQLETVRSAVTEYDGAPKKAIADGYSVLGPIVPGMGWHFLNNGYIQDAVENGFSLEKPQLVTYDTEWNLGAVEWGAPANQVPENPDLFATDEAEWRIHKGSTHLFATEDETVQNPSTVSFETVTTDDYWMEFHPPDRSIEPGDTVEKDFTKDGEPDKRVVDAAISHPDLNTLHAWVFVENPNGTFAATNPEFAQVGGGHEH